MLEGASESRRRGRGLWGARTLDLLESLAVELADLRVLVSEDAETSRQRERDVEHISATVCVASAVPERYFHLPYRRDHFMCVVHHCLFLGGYYADLVVESIRQHGK